MGCSKCVSAIIVAVESFYFLHNERMSSICKFSWVAFSITRLWILWVTLPRDVSRLWQVHSQVFHASELLVKSHAIGLCINATGCTNRKLLVTNASRHVCLDSQEGATSKIGIPSNLQTSITSCRITPGRTPSLSAAVCTSIPSHWFLLSLLLS